jgi:hypothetical protein
MPSVILQPAGGPAAAAHFNKTIRKPVSLRDILPFVTEADARELRAHYPKGAARVWGVTPGDNFRNKRKWERVEPGDVVLFCGGGEAFAYAFVGHKLHSRALAIELWDKDAEGRTWEYIYFVSEPMTHSIGYRQLARALDFSLDYVVLGFTVLDPEKSSRVLDEFNLVDD